MSLIGSILTEPGAGLFPQGLLYLSFSPRVCLFQLSGVLFFYSLPSPVVLFILGWCLFSLILNSLSLSQAFLWCRAQSAPSTLLHLKIPSGSEVSQHKPHPLSRAKRGSGTLSCLHCVRNVFSVSLR